MIEVISNDRCTGCNICVNVCPTNVFDLKPGGIPVIARQDDCQTCYMCELYCPVDALYVAPEVTPLAEPVDLAALKQRAVLGSYRRAIGWAKGSEARRSVDASFRLLGR